MTDKIEMEDDLNDSSDPHITYEAAEIPTTNTNKGRNSKPMRGLWSLPPDGFTLYKRTFNDKFAGVIEWNVSYFTKSIDFFRVFIYNVYYKHKHHERIKNVKKQDNTKSSENSNTNVKKDDSFKWSSVGRVIMGVATLSVVVSIAHSAWVIAHGTNDQISLIMAAPMVIWAGTQLLIQFLKQGDK